MLRYLIAALRSHAAICFFALSIACLAIPQTRAWADLSVAGATDRQSQTIEKVFSQRVPARFHRTATIDVQIFDRAAMLDYIRQGQPGESQADQDADDTIDGIYEDGPPTVTLRATNNLDSLSFTFAHEYGHYVWQDLMTPAERSHYARIYRRQRAAHHLVTAYAATELDEGFAEAFSFYAMEPPVLARRDPLSYQFLCSLRP